MIISIPHFSGGQSTTKDTSKTVTHIVEINSTQFVTFIDSLKKVTLADTSKFSRKDLIHTIIGTRNIKSYSPLFVINEKYLYKLDIIDGTNVLQFVNQYLDTNKFYKVNVADNIAGSVIYGSNGSNGCIIIYLKKKTKFNPLIAGLKMRNKKFGDNYDQYRKGELIIRD